MKRTVSGITLTLLFIGMLTLAFNIQTAKAESELQIIIGTTDSVVGTLDPAQAYDYFGWCILQQISGTLVSVKPSSARDIPTFQICSSNFLMRLNVSEWFVFLTGDSEACAR